METQRLEEHPYRPPSEQPERQGSVVARVSNAMVALHKEQFGRGPTKASTHFAGPDTMVSILRDSFTPAERNLVAMGEMGRMRDIRMLFQYSQRAQFVGAVEEITGRKVESFISGIDAEKDISTEVFLLFPERAPSGNHQGPHAV
jgi:uncharacterized protein YbcI